MNRMKGNEKLMDKVVALCKRRGLVFQSSEIYGGFAAVYDLGPYGVEIANAIKRFWWRKVVQLRDDVIGLDASIFMHPRVWEASGHVASFSDPLTECKNCHARWRVDHLLRDIGVEADEKMSDAEINQLLTMHQAHLKCSRCGKSEFTEARSFNLLVKSNLGNFTSDAMKEPVYLRGETCQGIYVNFLNVLNTMRVKIPFGIAQIGKAFRNEITARQFIFRTREFEQMEMQYFVAPENEAAEYERLRAERWQYYLDLGISEKNLQWRRHDKLAFYATEAYDVEYRFPFGFSELEGVHARGSHDLTQHAKFSGKDLTYYDPVTKQRYLPHVIETSSGVGRSMLAMLCEAYSEEMTEKAVRVVMRFPAWLAPVKVAVFPLASNKPALVEMAKRIHNSLKQKYPSEFDGSGNIGKKYGRQDEIGTPWCVTVDYQSLEDDTVTVRDRDTMQQERISADHLENYLWTKLV